MSRYRVFLSLIVVVILFYFLGQTVIAPLLNRGVSACSACVSFRKSVTERVYKYIPSPHAELLLGTTLGIDNLHLTPRFNDVLKDTGTIHVVVVSGYNISLVINRLLNLIRSTNSFFKVFTAQAFAVIYALITGFEPPVVRALLMASVILWARYKGKKFHIPLLLLITGAFMVLINFEYLASLSFQLSFLATLGIVLLYPRAEPFFKRFLGSNIFVEDLCASFSAQVFVMPLIYYSLKVLNFHGVLINAFTLWLIPLLTILGFIIIGSMFVIPVSSLVVSIVYTSISDIFVSLVNFSSFVV